MLAGCEQDGYVAKKYVVHQKLIFTKKAIVKHDSCA